jgi:CDP-4-dehydro-6-deoxyglucose reductase
MLFKISLKNNKSFQCDSDTTILNAAKNAGIFLEYSCLLARCRSCMVKVLEGDFNEVQEEFILSKEEKQQGYILSCNTKPLSNLKLDIEDFGGINLSEPRILPCKIDSIEKMTSTILRIVLRLPPKSNFNYEAGQYVNLIRGGVRRSYSIAKVNGIDDKVDFYIKEYKNGRMSNYWFREAKENDLLRIEGPLGTFFYRESDKSDIIFLATGTGIAPVKSMLEQLNANPKIKTKKVWLFWGGRYIEDFFWEPYFQNIDLNYIPVLSREDKKWKGEKGYVQYSVIKQHINLQNAQVYACGSVNMINEAKALLSNHLLPGNQFYSDAFINSN